MRRRHPKRLGKEHSLTKYVVFSLVSIQLFTIAMIVVFCIYQSVPDTLIGCYFGTFGGEILSCALIKIFKLKEESND